MKKIIFQSQFISNVQAVYGESGTSWLQILPNQIEELCVLWKCDFIHAMPHLTFNFVGIVQMRSDQSRAVLKMSPPKGPISLEMKWLRHFPGLVPNILRIDTDRGAFLMDECRPGRSLKELVLNGEDDTATRILCSTLKNLQAQPQKDSSFKHLSELIPDLLSLSNLAEPFLLSKAIDLFTQLTQDRSGDILLHGDLHHDNILSHHEGWKIIDPHGYMGDPASEVGVMIFNPVDSFPNDRTVLSLVEKRLRVLAENLPFDLKRIQAWGFCKTMLSAAWNVQDFGKQASFQLEIARTIHKLF